MNGWMDGERMMDWVERGMYGGRGMTGMGIGDGLVKELRRGGADGDGDGEGGGSVSGKEGMGD